MRSADSKPPGALRWYPKAWRDRYGGELAALIEDSYGERSLPMRARVSFMKGGTTERLRDAGIVGDHAPFEHRLRGASLLMLCAWAMMVVAGGGFAKYSEHWDAVTPYGARALPSAAFVAIQLAAIGATVIFVGAAVIYFGTFSRFVRDVGWSHVRRLLGPMVVSVTFALLATAAMVLWAHDLGSSQRNGGLWLYEVVGLAWVLVVVVTIVIGTATIVNVVQRLQFSRRTSLALGVLSLLMAASIAVIFASMLVWWVGMATNAPWFFASGVVGAAASPVAAPMVIFAIMMTASQLVALGAAARIIRTMARWHE
jgi:hypothetical protein